MKRASLIARILIVLTAITMVWLLAGCESKVQVPYSTAIISEVAMCRDLSPDFKPIDKTNTFTREIPTIYLSMKVSNAPSGTKIRADWYLVEAETEKPNSQLFTETTTARGTSYIGFSLNRKVAPWPKGDYQVKIFADDYEMLSAPYKVQ